MNNITETVAELVKQADNQEQYSRRNCLLVHGLFETTLENTDDLVITMFKNNMDIEIFSDDIDRSHRIGKQKDDPNTVRPVIVKFARYNDRNKIFRNKKTIKRKENVHHRKVNRIKNEHVKRG